MATLDRPNILFIMTDQQSAHMMSCASGNDHLNTPNMDWLAARGTRFTRAYSPNPLCVPARCSIFTGQHSHTTGILENDWHGLRNNGLDVESFPLMGTLFRDAGYSTGYFGKWHIASDKTVERTGFEEFAVNDSKGRDDEIATPTIEFITRKRDNPFLAVSSFSNPHDICQLARRQELPSGEVGDPPPPGECPPVPFNLEPPIDETDTMSVIRRSFQSHRLFPVGGFTDTDWQQLRWGYNRLVEKVDAEIGKVLDALREAALAENTLIVFTSDHGDCAGAHRFNQKTVFYEESVRIPFIVSAPGRAKSAVSDSLVNAGVDIIPTLLDFAGISVPDELPGKSVKEITLNGTSGLWRDYVVAENYMAQGEPVDGLDTRIQGRMVCSQNFKYCVYSHGQHRESLFDLANDPGETRSLAHDPAYHDVLAEHRNMLKQHAEETGDDLVDLLLADNVGPVPFERAGRTSPQC